MKNKITKLSLVLLLGMLSTVQVHAQTKEDIKLITKDYDINALNNLAERFGNEYKENYIEGVKIARERQLPIQGVTEEGRSFSLQGVVPGTDKLKYYITSNNVSSKSSIQTARVQYLHNKTVDNSLGIEGQGVTIGIWDNGRVFAAHKSFDSRVTPKDNSTLGIGDHASHVAGTMIANDFILDLKGMAPKAFLWSNDWLDDKKEMALQAADGLLVSNHSYGANYVLYKLDTDPTPFGKYESDAKKIDEIMYLADKYLPVYAAGNARNGDYINNKMYYFNTSKAGADLMHGESVSKNAVVVAAVEGVTDYKQALDVVMSSFSQWGPTDDFRIKPDISAKGVNVKSVGIKNDVDTDVQNGTSMAAPSVTGVFALWQQYYKHLFPIKGYMRSATVKALMAISADPAGLYTPANSSIPTLSLEGPDHRFGWGLINAKRGAEILRDSKPSVAVGKTEVIETELKSGVPYEIEVETDGSMPLKVAIAWTDPAAAVNTKGIDDKTPVLVNDLDLRIIRPNGDEVMPWKLNPDFKNVYAIKGDNDVDPIEVVEYKGPATGTASAGKYIIRVTNKGMLVSGMQKFSLIIDGLKKGTVSDKKEYFDNLLVYPNPSSDLLNISADLISIVDARIELFDISGKLVYSNPSLFYNTNSAVVNISELKAGIYILKIETEDTTQSVKVVKK